MTGYPSDLERIADLERRMAKLERAESQRPYLPAESDEYYRDAYSTVATWPMEPVFVTRVEAGERR